MTNYSNWEKVAGELIERSREFLPDEVISEAEGYFMADDYVIAYELLSDHLLRCLEAEVE